MLLAVRLEDLRVESHLSKSPQIGIKTEMTTPTTEMMASLDQLEPPSEAKGGVYTVALCMVSSSFCHDGLG